jgi:Protein of unknown function (DUF3455)
MRLLFLPLLVCSFCAWPAVGVAQDATLPPSEQHIVLTAQGNGVQIYVCQNSEASWQWVFQSPEAKLFDSSGKEIGAHGAGPMWKDADGSMVTGKLVAKANAPESHADIPWLLLKADKHEGKGVLSAVEYIRRSETHGGVAGGDGCDPAHSGAIARIPYTAVYTFYALQ